MEESFAGAAPSSASTPPSNLPLHQDRRRLPGIHHTPPPPPHPPPRRDSPATTPQPLSDPYMRRRLRSASLVPSRDEAAGTSGRRRGHRHVQRTFKIQGQLEDQGNMHCYFKLSMPG